MIEDRLWEQLPDLIFVSKEDFLRNLEDWDIEPVEIDGELAFALLTKGTEFHFQSFNTGHLIPMKIIREHIQELIDMHGYATTATPKDDVQQHRINMMFGCKVVSEDEYDRHYRIDRLRHA